jgi:hypothetical protein
MDRRTPIKRQVARVRPRRRTGSSTGGRLTVTTSTTTTTQQQQPTSGAVVEFTEFTVHISLAEQILNSSFPSTGGVCE